MMDGNKIYNAQKGENWLFLSKLLLAKQYNSHQDDIVTTQ
jgi:hypothetical protein